MREGTQNAAGNRAWRGYAVLGTAVVAALAYAYFRKGAIETSHLIVLSFLPAALIETRIWLNARWLPALVGLPMLALWLLGSSMQLPIQLTAVDVVVIVSGCWLVQLLIRRAAGRRRIEAIHVGIVKDDSVHAYDELDGSVRAEFGRSRRHERPLSVLRIRMSALRNIPDSERNEKTRELRESLRWIDRIYATKSPGDYFVLCPETSASGAELLVDRLRSVLDASQPFLVGWATFPDEVLTPEALFETAQLKLNAAAENYRQETIRGTRAFATNMDSA